MELFSIKIRCTFQLVSTDKAKHAQLYKELDMLTTEEKIANGLLQFEVSENVRLSVMDKIQNYYAPKLKAYYATL
jgi:hypothetical protein